MRQKKNKNICFSHGMPIKNDPKTNQLNANYYLSLINKGDLNILEELQEVGDLGEHLAGISAVEF